MSKPQQAELRRSGYVASLDPDATESEIEAWPRPDKSGAGGPIPEDNQPGHHPDHEQDKPSGERFVAKVRSLNGRRATPAPSTAAPFDERGSNDSAGSRDRAGLIRVGMVAAGAVGAAVGIVRAVRNRTPLLG